MDAANWERLEKLVNSHLPIADPDLPCRQMLLTDKYHPTLCTFKPGGATERMLKQALDHDDGNGVDGDVSSAKRIGRMIEDLKGSAFNNGDDEEKVKRIFRITLLARNRLGLEVPDTHKGFVPANKVEAHESDAGFERTAGETNAVTELTDVYNPPLCTFAPETAAELVLKTALNCISGMCVGSNPKESFRQTIDDIECEAFYSTGADAFLVPGSEKEEIRSEKFVTTLLARNRVGLELTKIHDESFRRWEKVPASPM
jgi:hypothetical protein